MKKVIIAGLLGGLVLIIWSFVVNGLLGFGSSINMKQVQNERPVYEMLKENVTQPGRYVVNPEATTEGRFPDEDPVYSVLYSGRGHGTAGGQMFAGLAVFFLVPMIGAWLLTQASNRVLSNYLKKVFFFFVIGLLFALFCGFGKFGIGGYPLRDALMLGLHDIVVWTLVGLVIAWRIKPIDKYSMA